MENNMEFWSLCPSIIGKTIKAVDGLEQYSGRVTITLDDDSTLSMFHYQDCCESVSLVDWGDTNSDELVGGIVVLFENAPKTVTQPIMEHNNTLSINSTQRKVISPCGGLVNPTATILFLFQQNWRIKMEIQLMMTRVASRYLEANANDKSMALIRWLSEQTRRLRIADHVYVVGGAVRNFVLNEPIKDVDVMVDAINSRLDSLDLAKALSQNIPSSSVTINNYGVAIINVSSNSSWSIGDIPLLGRLSK